MHRVKQLNGKRLVFNGRLLKLFKRKKRLPNGFLVDLELIEHPGAVLVVPFISKKEMILIRQFRPVIDSYIWEFPAGTLGKGEKPLDCAKREMREEIGYTAKTWKKLGVIYTTPGYTTELIYIYSAYGLKKEKTEKQPDEVISKRTFNIQQAQKLLSNGKIVDAKTICAFKLLD